jgi:hypothetical protein
VISRKSALRITSENFPNGPEKLAEHLSVEVTTSPLVGVEGWCVRGVNTIIRLNSSSSKFRQRFTLAHELAHLVLGTEPDIATEPFRSERQEERDADQLASSFLIPDAQLQTFVARQLPIDAKTLTRLAKAANVSPVMAACRVVSATEELGLKNAAVVFYVDGLEQWRYSHGLQFDKDEARSLLHDAVRNKPSLVREQNHDGNIIVGSAIDAQAYQVLLVQLLPASDAEQETYEEKLGKLANEIFGNDRSFRQSIAGSLGTVKNKCDGKTLRQAFEFFMKNYPGVKYSGKQASILKSKNGQEYIMLYLQRWFQ